MTSTPGHHNTVELIADVWASHTQFWLTPLPVASVVDETEAASDQDGIADGRHTHT